VRSRPLGICAGNDNSSGQDEGRIHLFALKSIQRSDTEMTMKIVTDYLNPSEFLKKLVRNNHVAVISMNSAPINPVRGKL